MTALRSQLVKGNAQTKLYRDYYSFDVNLFKEDLNKNLKSNNKFDFSDFQNTFIIALHKHSPIKKKIHIFNNSPFMSKALRKAVMHRSKLKNIFNKKMADVNWANYKNGIFVMLYFGELFSKSRCERLIRQQNILENNWAIL